MTARRFVALVLAAALAIDASHAVTSTGTTGSQFDGSSGQVSGSYYSGNLSEGDDVVIHEPLGRTAGDTEGAGQLPATGMAVGGLVAAGIGALVAGLDH